MASCPVAADVSFLGCLCMLELIRGGVVRHSLLFESNDWSCWCSAWLLGSLRARFALATRLGDCLLLLLLLAWLVALCHSFVVAAGRRSEQKNGPS